MPGLGVFAAPRDAHLATPLLETIGGLEEARKIVQGTRLFSLAESLGGVESLIEHPGIMTHASVANSPLAVPDNLIRLSVGIEDAEDLIRDLATAME